MESFVSSLSTGLPKLEWKRQLREDDLRYRAILTERRMIDDARRAVDEKTEQLKAIAELSIIIAGFTISALCEIHISPTVAEGMLVLFGCVTSGSIAVMVICALSSYYVLVALYRHDTTKRSPTFEHFWMSICEDDWQIAFSAFIFGMFLSAMSLCASAWVLYWNHPYGVLAASLVTIISLGSIIFWYVRVYLKWATALEKGNSKIVMRQMKQAVRHIRHSPTSAQSNDGSCIEYGNSGSFDGDEVDKDMYMQSDVAEHDMFGSENPENVPSRDQRIRAVYETE